MNKLKHIFLTAVLCALSSTASAVPIFGEITFEGSLTTNTDNVLTATVFDFANSVTVKSATGDFAALTGSTVTYSQLVTPAVGSISPFTAVTPLWTVDIGLDTYSFDLNSITTNATAFGFIRAISGSGTFDLAGKTGIGEWNFTTQNPGSSPSPYTFTFSASQAPEPAVALLLGTGLLGFGVTRKLRKKA